MSSTFEVIDSYASLRTQVCAVGFGGFIAGAVVMGPAAGIICATSLIITYGCLYYAYVIQPSRNDALKKTALLEESLRNSQRINLELEQRIAEQSQQAERTARDKDAQLVQSAALLSQQCDELESALNQRDDLQEERENPPPRSFGTKLLEGIGNLAFMAFGYWACREGW